MLVFTVHGIYLVAGSGMLASWGFLSDFYSLFLTHIYCYDLSGHFLSSRGACYSIGLALAQDIIGTILHI